MTGKPLKSHSIEYPAQYVGPVPGQPGNSARRPIEMPFAAGATWTSGLRRRQARGKRDAPYLLYRCRVGAALRCRIPAPWFVPFGFDSPTSTIARVPTSARFAVPRRPGACPRRATARRCQGHIQEAGGVPTFAAGSAGQTGAVRQPRSLRSRETGRGIAQHVRDVAPHRSQRGDGDASLVARGTWSGVRLLRPSLYRARDDPRPRRPAARAHGL